MTEHNELYKKIITMFIQTFQGMMVEVLYIYISVVLYSILSILKRKYITAYSGALQELQMKDTQLGKYPILHIVLIFSDI